MKKTLIALAALSGVALAATPITEDYASGPARFSK